MLGSTGIFTHQRANGRYGGEPNVIIIYMWLCGPRLRKRNMRRTKCVVEQYSKETNVYWRGH